MTHLLELKNVDKRFNPHTPDEFYALDDLNLSIEAGDFITIIGGNGAGKSTLLNAIAGSFDLDAGKILLEGEDITETNDIERAAYISRVFQDPKMGTAPRMTVEENLALAEKRGQTRGLQLALDQDKRAKYKQILKQLGLGLDERLEAEIGLLSGGQRQSVALLMATIVKPKLLLLDEHTAALDPKTSRRILEITAQQVSQENLTALMITHNLQDALTYGNRMILMDRGHIIRDFSQAEKEALNPTQLYSLMEEINQ
ncbi:MULTISPECIES: ABC transporter ATP-binding protein [Aerococcus]|uniref:ATP-binding cassette domain-containing protein n=1 Tax=Aerococcus sanguinicola TaxID=119206 RepID=A0A5N1GLL1_9LACT|nr:MULTISPECIES: ATP-binding cassette domain-containing protein [Aerococcus]KAA9301865.1 ATP-binding cassette domain-containing protein [Aerococcus sanguinicola]MDK6368713.1 ATP-binding cassette domain-containing protein [Aerococcus sp. UMB9870]MDK6679261.1 ATP-binding cassette domain-containing protein [Aerococcus sp. UMB8608]MDK6685897.1 ATP-binding cassette domain-containing protein [Aerococcus sp. UMB8623]MDK6939336.1 ATP-binding cassette domain-containing protein [Aerococcus sp. UMB8487]